MTPQQEAYEIAYGKALRAFERGRTKSKRKYGGNPQQSGRAKCVELIPQHLKGEMTATELSRAIHAAIGKKYHPTTISDALRGMQISGTVLLRRQGGRRLLWRLTGEG